MTHDSQDPENTPETKDRLVGISPVRQPRKHSKNYSTIIKTVQITLPIIALGIILVTFNWNRFQDEGIAPIQKRAEEIVQTNITKNELLNPRFESVDDKNQPYTLIAERATQEKSDEDIVMLESPSGEMKLNSGDVVTLTAKNGEYAQSLRQLMLTDDVKLFYNNEYEMDTQALHIDMQTSKASSDVDVFAKGPEGTLEAKGLKGSSIDETLIFTGPAKLVLIVEKDALNMGGLPQ